MAGCPLAGGCSILEPIEYGHDGRWAMADKCGVSIGIAATFAVLSALGAPSRADTLVVNDQLQVRESNVARPARGLTMSAVEAKFGAPSTKHEAVGTPPITRWDYPQFAVFFEKDRVIDAVLPPPAAEPSSTPQSTAATSTPSSAATSPSDAQEPVAPTPATAPMPADAPIPSGAPNPPAAPAQGAAPSAAPAAPSAPSAPATTPAPPALSVPAAHESAPPPAATSSEDPIGVVPVSIGPSAAAPTPSSGTPTPASGTHVAPGASHP